MTRENAIFVFGRFSMNQRVRTFTVEVPDQGTQGFSLGGSDI